MGKKVAKKVENCVLFEDGSILIKNVIASFPHLAEPYAKRGPGQSDEEFEASKKYSITGMLNSETHSDAIEMISGLCKKLASDADVKVGKSNYFIKDGDDSGRDEYEGFHTVNARDAARPNCWSRSNVKMDKSEVREKFYAGCVINLMLKPWVQDNSFGKRVNANLVAVQFVQDGERIGEGRVSDEGAFESYEDDDNGFDDEDL